MTRSLPTAPPPAPSGTRPRGEPASGPAGDDIPVVVLPEDLYAELFRAAEEIADAGAASVVQALTDAGVPPRVVKKRTSTAAPRTDDGAARAAADAARQAEIDEELALERIEAQLNRELEDELAYEARMRARRITPLWICRASACLIVCLLAVLCVVGWGYYTMPLSARVLHHLHAALRPSSGLGLSLGFTGLGVMVASLGYVARKRFSSWRRLGSVRDWMGFHVLAGIVGPAIVAFHAAFLPTSAVGLLAIFAMAVVVASGIAGKYVYVHVPKTLEGHELEFEVIRRRLVVYRRKLLDLGLDPALLPVDDAATKPKRNPFFLWSLVVVLWGDQRTHADYARLHRAVNARRDLALEMERVLALAKRLCLERQALARYRELRKVVSTWRFLHRWLAVVLGVAVTYHVLVAAKFGGLWIFGGR